MIKDITIGQYFPGNSLIHRLDPRTKILGTIAYIVALILTKNMWGFLLCGVFLLAVVLISRISLKVVLRSARPLIFIMAFTSLFQLIYSSGTPIFDDVSWLKWLTWTGVYNALFMSIRIILLVMGSSFMTYTTSPIMLTSAMERLMAPLKVLRLPVHEMVMMITIALRFIPVLVDETDKIINAQKARGADFETGNILRRAKALVPILIPLILSAFRRAEELASAMECRCYNGGSGRTRYKVYHFGIRDLVAAGIMTAMIVGILWMNAHL